MSLVQIPVAKSPSYRNCQHVDCIKNTAHAQESDGCPDQTGQPLNVSFQILSLGRQEGKGRIFSGYAVSPRYNAVPTIKLHLQTLSHTFLHFLLRINNNWNFGGALHFTQLPHMPYGGLSYQPSCNGVIPTS